MKRANLLMWAVLAISSCLFASCGHHHESSPTDSSAMVPAAGTPSSSQNVDRSDNWHYDQAEADALRNKANADQNITEALEYSEMLYQKNLHDPPTNEVSLPNFESGLGVLEPVGLNFYERDVQYPAYLLCTYDVDEKPYDRSNEPGWFKMALLQIRRSGSGAFPPIRWIAVSIFNRAEHKGASTFEQSFKVGAIFNASEVFDPSRDPMQLVTQAVMDRHPFVFDLTKGSPGEQQRWVIVERHAAAAGTTTGPN